MPFSEVCGDQRGRRILQKPVLDFFGLGDGKNAAGCSEGVTRKARMDFGEALEGLPGWGFADGDVRIIWNERLSMGGIDDAHGEAGAEARTALAAGSGCSWPRTA